jgi:hypothetical protein
VLVGVGTTLAGAQAELVEQAKWRGAPQSGHPRARPRSGRTVGGTRTHRTGVGEEPEQTTV